MLIFANRHVIHRSVKMYMTNHVLYCILYAPLFSSRLQLRIDMSDEKMFLLVLPGQYIGMDKCPVVVWIMTAVT